jgi:hypothetical protein
VCSSDLGSDSYILAHTASLNYHSASISASVDALIVDSGSFSQRVTAVEVSSGTARFDSLEARTGSVDNSINELNTFTGSFSAYFEDAALINRFLNETESAIEVSVTDAASVVNSYAFTFPRVKINSADVGVDGPTSRVISMSFTALYDTTANTNLKIVRTPFS